ncbi:DIL domain-containing protein [Helicostylum pulchrum]|uniref:Dilute domain-containing protein n=1 Tax=Helicostylum pulchrum TaxID=562976 RepID=A0ABP9Y439_9FUNG|nr:DIL domain-containing protein [Helicostylum pulchrum]
MNQHYEEDSDASQSGRKNKQHTFSWSSTSSSNSTQFSTHSLEEELEQVSFLSLQDFEFLDGAKKTERLSEILSRSASHGDLVTIRHLVTDTRLSPYVDWDASDDETDGSTPLIYASCFGKIEVVRFLLQVGAKVDVQDKIGWTALMWATTNGHGQIVKLLLEYSASSSTRSRSGRTIYDLVDTENEHMVSILSPCTTTLSDIEPVIALPVKQQQQHDQDIQSCEASFRSVHKFIWDQCLPDQMFVFAEDEIDHILNVSISHLKLPMKSRTEIYVPANIIFLCARFAHYYTCRELVHQLISKAVARIDTAVKTSSQDVHIMAFWIANLSQLLYYLKKDVGLVVATAEYQLEISELISETYTLLVTDSEKRMDRVLEPAMIEYEQLGGLEVVEFADDWHRFFRRSRFSSSSNRRSVGNTQAESPVPQTRSTLTPQSVTSLLTSILYVLQSYDVHPVIVIQAMAQLFHFLSCEMFNRILSNKKYLCRSKALQIRMNLTVIEEWVREHHLPSTLGAYFNPVVQLVQLLQCVSQLQDLMDFISTTKSFDLLNPMQVKRLVLNYRYEVSETRLKEEVEKYTMQIAEDTIKSIQGEQQQQLIERSSSLENQSRPNSISSLGSLLQSISQQKNNRKSRQSSVQSGSDTDSIYTENDEDNHYLTEKKDSKYMLPFSLPTTTNMMHSGWHHKKQEEQRLVNDDSLSLSDSIYIELKTKLSAEREKNARESSVIPSIPEEWLERLDHHSTSQY